MLNLARSFVAAGGFDRVADPGAIDQDAFLAVGFARFGKTGVDVFVAGYVDLAKDAADFSSNRFAFLFIHIEDRDFRALRGQRANSGCAQT